MPEDKDLSNVLSRAKDMSGRIDAAMDALNAKLSEAEKALASLGLGVRARVEMDPPAEGGKRWLTYGKQGNSWRLLMERDAAPGKGAGPAPSLLSNTSMEIRLEAVRLLPKLLDALLVEMNNKLHDVEAATNAVAAWNKALKGDAKAAPKK